MFLINIALFALALVAATAALTVVMLWQHSELNAVDEALSLRYSEGRITLDEWDAELSLHIERMKDDGRWPPETLGDKILRWLRVKQTR